MDSLEPLQCQMGTCSHSEMDWFPSLSLLAKYSGLGLNNSTDGPQSGDWILGWCSIYCGGSRSRVSSHALAAKVTDIGVKQKPLPGTFGQAYSWMTSSDNARLQRLKTPTVVYKYRNQNWGKQWHQVQKTTCQWLILKKWRINISKYCIVPLFKEILQEK